MHMSVPLYTNKHVHAYASAYVHVHVDTQVGLCVFAPLWMISLVYARKTFPLQLGDFESLIEKMVAGPKGAAVPCTPCPQLMSA